jgi:hypothetical protein
MFWIFLAGLLLVILFLCYRDSCRGGSGIDMCAKNYSSTSFTISLDNLSDTESVPVYPSGTSTESISELTYYPDFDSAFIYGHKTSADKNLEDLITDCEKVLGTSMDGKSYSLTPNGHLVEVNFDKAVEEDDTGSTSVPGEVIDDEEDSDGNDSFGREGVDLDLR